MCALSRAVDKDIDAAAEALQVAQRPRIHTGLGVSPSHLHEKLHISEEECIERVSHCVRYARNLCDDVQFYAEDAGRSDYAFWRACARRPSMQAPPCSTFPIPRVFHAR